MGTQFDKITTRYAYWEVLLPPPPCVLQQRLLHICVYIVSFVVIFCNWVCDNCVYQFPLQAGREGAEGRPPEPLTCACKTGIPKPSKGSLDLSVDVLVDVILSFLQGKRPREFHEKISEAQRWRKRNMTHQCSHKRAPASAHASAHASVHESAHKSWLPPRHDPIQRLPLECSRECSHGCPRKCTRSGLVVCHLVCFHLLCSLPQKSTPRNPRRKASLSALRSQRYSCEANANYDAPRKFASEF